MFVKLSSGAGSLESWNVGILKYWGVQNISFGRGLRQLPDLPVAQTLPLKFPFSPRRKHSSEAGQHS